MTPVAFYARTDDGRLAPTKYSLGLWAPNTLHGPAVCGLAARTAEVDFGRDGFRPARFTIDLFKAARRVPTVPVGRVLRDGGRLRVVEIDVVQYPDAEPVTVARSTTMFVREATNPPGERWTRPTSAPGGPDVAADDYHGYYQAPDASDPAWTRDMTALQAPVRKRLSTPGVPIIVGDGLSAFQRAVLAAESTSLVTNWGDTGIGFINSDVTVLLARLPRAGRIVVESDSHLEYDGISTGTSNLYDAHGQFGTGAVVAVNNAAAEIDFTTVKPQDRYRDDAPTE